MSPVLAGPDGRRRGGSPARRVIVPAALLLAVLLLGPACCCYTSTAARTRPPGRREPAGARARPAATGAGPVEVRVRLTEAGSPAVLTHNRAVVLSRGRETARVEAGGSIRLSLERGVRVEAGGRTWPAGPETLRLRPVEPGLWSLGGRRYRGAMLAFTDREGGLAVVNELDIEEYLASVVPCEIGPINDATFEAVKAQAVAARSFTLTRLEARKGLGHSLFDTYRRDQEYKGAGAEVELARQAVRETAGEVLLWQGAPLEALYHANCGGMTAPGSNAALRSVRDTPGGRAGRAWCGDGRHYSWTLSLGREEFERKLAVAAGQGRRVRVRGVRVERDESGRARRLNFTSDKGSFSIGSSDFRFGIGLKSTLFEVELGTRTVKFTGRGWGHGVGLCQEGAVAMARAGKDHRAILGHYYPAATIGRR